MQEQRCVIILGTGFALPTLPAGIILPNVLRATDPPALAAAPKAAPLNSARRRRRPALPMKTHASRWKIFLVKKSNDSFVDPKNYFGTERVPPPAQPHADACSRRLAGDLKPRRVGGCRRDVAPPTSRIPPNYEPQRPPVARDVVQSRCTRFSLVLTLSALRPGLLYRGSLLGASTNRQETESFTAHTHCLPGANFEQKKTLFISFIYKS